MHIDTSLRQTERYDFFLKKIYSNKIQKYYHNHKAITSDITFSPTSADCHLARTSPDELFFLAPLKSAVGRIDTFSIRWISM